MVDNMKESFAELIEQSPWMDKETKEKSLLKIKNMKSQVAYPNVIINTPILNEFYKYVGSFVFINFELCLVYAIVSISFFIIG